MISKAAAKQQLQAAEPVSPGDVRSSATTHTVSYNPYSQLQPIQRESFTNWDGDQRPTDARRVIAIASLI